MSVVVEAVAPVRVPQRSLRSEARAVKAVWRRELIRFAGDRAGGVTWLVQPLLFLFVLGSGLQTLSARSTGGVDLKTFIFPGAICNAALFAAMISAASLVWDRELGFLRELLVAPVSRASIIVGKCLGGATIATVQGVVVLALAGLVGVPYDPVLILGVLGLLVLLAFAVTAFGILVAVRIKQARTFTAVMQLFVFPMFFLSGALYPVEGLPGWLEALNRINPMTYAVDPMRHMVFERIDVAESARRALDPGISWFGWQLPALFEAAMVLVLGLVMAAAAVRHFSRTE